MNCRRLGKMLLLLVALVCLTWVIPAAALDTNVRIVRLSYASGDVQLDRAEGEGYERAVLNMPIVQGSRLWTRGEDALAEAEFEDGSTLRLTPGTAVEFQELSLRGSGEKVSSVNLQSGTAYFDIRNRMGDFRVTCGAQQISISHPARFRLSGDNGQFKLAVYKGNVDVRNGENRVEVRSGETVSVDLSDPNRYNLSKSIADASYDAWNQERQSYTQSNTTAGSYSGDSSYGGFSPAYSYGLADLTYYGNYFYAPGWGWAWQPYYIGAAWNPFMDGAWVWYPQFGYLWVSSYPWGWMPYRYGAWNFIPGYGWCWMPGTTWNTWTPVTVVNRRPLNWVPVRPPAAPPQPGSSGIVAVGRTWGTMPARGLSGTQPVRPRVWGTMPARESSGTQPNRAPVWGTPSRAAPSSSVVTNSVAPQPATSSTPAVKTNTPAAPAPKATAPPPAQVPHGVGWGRPSSGSRPSAPSAAPTSQSSPSSAGSQAGGGGHSGESSGGGHAGGGWGSHGGNRR